MLELVIEGRRRDLGGGLEVGRVLPFARRHMIGPFIFLGLVEDARSALSQKTSPWTATTSPVSLSILSRKSPTVIVGAARAVSATPWADAV
jgi:hypothetical protein